MLEVIVTHKRKEALDICSFELARVDGKSLPVFSAGSHIDVHIGPGLVRQYSLCNHPEENHRYLIGVLLDPASRGGSKAMHEQIVVGQTLSISEPRNLFPLEHSAARTVLFAGGIGITPILCMAERLAQSGADFELHYAARSAERAAFQARIRESSFASQVHLHFDDAQPAQPLDMATLLREPHPSTHLYVCGPTGFMEFVLRSARELGWSEDTLHREYFSASPDVQAGGASFEIQLASSGDIYVIPEDQTIIDVLYEAGIDIPVSCEQGICGTCITRVLEGEPDHRDSFLTEIEKARNNQFTPCCSRAKSARLVLDI
ncbi:PDR/VanB family oxidoreductase [Pseudomonas aeruginosa]